MKHFFKKYLVIILPALLLLLIINLFIFSKVKNDGINDKVYSDNFRKYYKIFAVSIPDEISFCNEQVPIQRYDVRESFDRELHINTYWQSQTLLFFKRANRWFPAIERILKKHQLPDDLKYIALVESGLMNVKSPAGATGYWQFMKPTAKSYGLEINDEVDERYHMEKSTEAACKYFTDAFKIYKNWTLAAASYNIGFGALNKEMQNQKVSSYYDLFLNEETGRYIYRILAVKLLMNNAAAYGFYFRKKDVYPQIPCFSVEVDTAITNLALFAKNFKISYKLLRDCNPWIMGYTLSNKEKKTYSFIIPKVDSLDYNILLKDTAEEIKFYNDSI